MPQKFPPRCFWGFLLVLLIWVGQRHPDPDPWWNVYTEVWQRSDMDTTWVQVIDQVADKDGIVIQDVTGPAWVKARWRWDLWRVFELPGATTVPPPRQTIYGPFSPVHYVAPEPLGREIPPTQHLRVP